MDYFMILCFFVSYPLFINIESDSVDCLIDGARYRPPSYCFPSRHTERRLKLIESAVILRGALAESKSECNEDQTALTFGILRTMHGRHFLSEKVWII